MSNQHRICTDCGDPHFGKVNKCRKCQKKAIERKRSQRPEVKERQRRLQAIRKQDPAVRERDRITAAARRVARKIEEANALLTPEQLERKEREREVKRDYAKRQREGCRNVQDERPPGTSSNGNWRCKKCGGKILGSEKRCVACYIIATMGKDGEAN